jgi:hypothetical protein
VFVPSPRGSVLRSFDSKTACRRIETGYLKKGGTGFAVPVAVFVKSQRGRHLVESTSLQGHSKVRYCLKRLSVCAVTLMPQLGMSPSQLMRESSYPQ